MARIWSGVSGAEGGLAMLPVNSVVAGRCEPGTPVGLQIYELGQKGPRATI